MKLKLFVVGCLILSALTTNPVQAQIYTKGDILIEGYYGTPAYLTSVLHGRSMFKFFPNYTSNSSKQLGRLGLNAEYLLNSYIGVGIDFTNYHFQDDVSAPLPTVIYDGGFVPYTWNFNRFSPNIRFNYHFIQRKSFEVFSFAEIGLRLSKTWRVYQNAATKADQNKMPLQIGFGVGLGVRYFITPRIGIHINTSYGTSAFLNTGISIRLSTSKK